jgi:hypothetical protein
VSKLIDRVDRVKSAKLNGQPMKVSNTVYWATVDVVSGSSSTPVPFTGILGSAGGKWCWKNMSGAASIPESVPSPRSTISSRTSTSRSQSGTASGEGAALVQSFVNKINAKDTAGASSLVCPGSEGNAISYIEKATSGSPNITVALSGSGNYLIGDVNGTFNGKNAGGIVLAHNPTGTFCISGFVVY